MTFRSDATEGVWSPTQNVAVQTEANVVAIFFFHQCGFYDPTHHIRSCQKIIWNFALKGRALVHTTNDEENGDNVNDVEDVDEDDEDEVDDEDEDEEE